MKNQTTNTTSTTKTSSYARFKYLKTMLHQFPRSIAELDELISLAEKYNKKMAKYLKDNYDEMHI